METLTALRGRMVATLLVLAAGGLWGSASGARAAMPNDPAFPLQWADRNTGQKIPFQDNSETLGAPENGTPGVDDRALAAWRLSTGSSAVVVGVLDSGVQYSHPDLAANIWTNPGGVGGCAAGTHGFNVITESCDPQDEDTSYGGHGTHVAGIIGAVGDNGLGVAGVSWQTSILSVKWVQSAGAETNDLLDALKWLLKAREAGVNIRVVNDSLTFSGTLYSPQVKREIEALGEHNVLFVTAAGNTGEDNDNVLTRRYPCDYGLANEICVTATNNRAELPAWANYGPHTVDLAAPGVSIYSTLREGRYGYLTGGSMASAQVSGAAALILSVDPGLTAAELKALILGGVDHLPSLEGKVITGGTLDICRAMPGCEPPPVPTVATLAPTSVTQTSATLAGSVNPNGGEVSDCHFDYGTVAGAYGGRLPCSPMPGAGTGAVAVSAALGGLSPSTTYHYRIVASNAGGTNVGADQTFTSAPAAAEPESPATGQPPGLGNQPGSGGTLAVAGSHVRAAQPMAVLPTLLGRSLRAGAAGVLHVSLACPAGVGGCTGKLVLRVLSPPRQRTGRAGRGNTHSGKPVLVTAASGSFAIASGASAAIVLRLPPAVRRLLARVHVLHGVAVLEAPGPAGGAPRVELAVGVRAPLRARGAR